MQLIFIDESGYTLGDWAAGIADQPYYALAAVCIPSDICHSAYEGIRQAVGNLKLPGTTAPIGQGIEIKAKEVARGEGWWKEHNDERNSVRDLMLSFPKTYGGVAFVVVVNKRAHWEQYAYPQDPYTLSLTFALERLQIYLNDIDQFAVCIYDMNERLESLLQTTATDLIRSGSTMFSSLLGKFYTLPIDRILEFVFGRSQYSIGLQVASFFATMTYQYVKDGKPSPCDWWETLTSSLHQPSGRLRGVGYKEFP